MIKVVLIALSLLMTTVFGYSVDTIVLKGGIDFEKQLSVNEIFLRNCRDFDMDPDKELIYFLDSTYCHIFKVDMKTGKLLKTISSRGQGPSELMSPVSMKAENDLLVVLDRGFGGIKIFAPDGKLINEFRVNNYIIGNRSIDVNDKNEIYLGVVDFNENSMVSVYDIHGKKKRSLIRYRGDKDLKESISKVSRYQYFTKLDKKGNILVLFYMLRKLAKYSPNGELIWEKDIRNKILDKIPRDEYINLTQRTISSRYHIFGLDVTSNNDIIIGHGFGGCVFNENGELKKIIQVPRIENARKERDFDSLSLFKIKKNILINISGFGERIYWYTYKEVSQ
jgi:hypothetical protein